MLIVKRLRRVQTLPTRLLTGQVTRFEAQTRELGSPVGGNDTLRVDLSEQASELSEIRRRIDDGVDDVDDVRRSVEKSGAEVPAAEVDAQDDVGRRQVGFEVVVVIWTNTWTRVRHLEILSNEVLDCSELKIRAGTRRPGP